METTRIKEGLRLAPHARLADVSLDVTTRVARELTAAQALFETTFAAAPVGMLLGRAGKDGTLDVVECNPAFVLMVGREPAELLGRGAFSTMHPDSLDECQRLLDEALAGRPASGEVRLTHRDGRDIWALIAPAMTHGPDGERLVVLQAVDISERKSLEKRLRHLADHDALTGVLSRRRFEEELDREVSRARRHGRAGILILLDLDGFKEVNDRLGHATGDRLLTRIAGALRGTLRGTDSLARIGGDEFGLVMPDTDSSGAEVIARKLTETVRAHGAVTSASGQRVDVTASIGMTSFDGQTELNADQLLIEADLAMDRAKHAGKSSVSAHARVATATAG
jgi:diguanylate cyclase (GGDEF)-like protein/PAS domain S-box-containing protein